MSEILPNKSEIIAAWKSLADKLDDLQRTKNSGMGVGCVQNIIGRLRAGNVEDARTICSTDADKIRNHPDIQQVLIDELFAGEAKHPLS